MNLAAVYNVFDGEEHLEKSVSYLLDHVSSVIIVYQTISNFGEEYIPKIKLKHDKINYILYLPTVYNNKETGTINERAKRLLGLEKAKELGATHFLFVDCDEYYPDFKALRQEYLASDCDASVCSMEMYLAKPTYRLTPKLDWYVPFIHELKEDTTIVNRYPYPVDKTRSTTHSKVKLLSKPMHHMSWVRDDLERKIRNSSATGRNNDRARRDIGLLLSEGPNQFVSRYFNGRYIREVKEI